MNTLQAPSRTAAVLAQLLERLDASPSVDAHQYQLVVDRLAGLLADPSVNWEPLLAASPAAAVVYENLHYDAAGLCRSPLDSAAGAEMEARELIGRVRRPVAPGATPPV